MCCRYLSDEDDGVSEVMIPFAVQYIGVLKVHVHVRQLIFLGKVTTLGVLCCFALLFV